MTSDMSDLFLRLASQVPSLVVLVIVVVIFLKYLTKRDEVLKHLGDDCHEVQRDAIKAIKQNSEVIGEISVVLRRLNDK